MRHFRNDTYTSLKWIGMIVLPAIGSAIFIVGGLLGWPYVKDVLGAGMLLILKINSWVWWSAKRYYESDDRFDGYIVLEEDPGGVKKMNLIVEGDPETLLMLKDEITFQVKRH